MTKVGPDIFVGAALGDGEAKAGALFVDEGQGLGEFRCDEANPEDGSGCSSKCGHPEKSGRLGRTRAACTRLVRTRHRLFTTRNFTEIAGMADAKLP